MNLTELSTRQWPSVAVAVALVGLFGLTSISSLPIQLLPIGDVRSQTFEALIDLPQGASANWTVGQLVSVAVPIRARQTSLTIPRDALVLWRFGR